MNDNSYFNVTGEMKAVHNSSNITRASTIYCAADSDDAIRMFVKDYPLTTYIADVHKTTQKAYLTQEGNKEFRKNQEAKRQRWDQVLKEAKKQQISCACLKKPNKVWSFFSRFK